MRRRLLHLTAALGGGLWAAEAAPAAAPGADVLPSQSMLEPRSDSAERISDLWWGMLIVATIVVAIVVMLAVLAVLRPEGGRGDRLAARLGNRWLVLFGGLVLPLVILSGLFYFTLSVLTEAGPTDLEPRMVVEVRGRQWFWDVRYPGREAAAVSANEIHVPVGVPVAIRVRTADVNHSFWVPQLDRKVDLIPDRDNYVTFAADEAGVYRGQCAEFCGPQHGNMAFLVVAQPPAEFAEYLDRIAAPAAEPLTWSARAGRRVFLAKGCGSCHRIAGTPAQGDVGPDLSHLALRRTLAAGTIPNTRGDLGGWIMNPQAIKPGNKMPAVDLTGPQLQALLDYLQGLE